MFFFAGMNLLTPLFDEDLAEVETLYLCDRSYDTIRSGRKVVEYIKFKKSDPRLQVIANAKTLQAPIAGPPSLKRKGVMISEDPKRHMSTPLIDAPLILGYSRPTFPIPSKQRIVLSNPLAGVHALRAATLTPPPPLSKL